jgi:hypothetical protein
VAETANHAADTCSSPRLDEPGPLTGQRAGIGIVSAVVTVATVLELAAAEATEAAASAEAAKSAGRRESPADHSAQAACSNATSGASSSALAGFDSMIRAEARAAIAATAAST